MLYEKNDREKPLALIVDDDFSLRLSMGAALKKVGFDIIEAENGYPAISLFQQEKPDLILLDVVMPEMDGFETCAAIRKLPEGKFPQILMVTGLDDTDSTMQAFEAGANDFVSKPINWVMLGHRGKYMLRSGQAFRELHINKSLLTKTLQLAKIGNWQIDLLTNDFQCSPEAGNLLGLNSFESSISFDDFLAPVCANELQAVKDTIEEAVYKRKYFSLNYTVMYLDGTQKHILNQGGIVNDENGKPNRMLGVVQDVTQLKEAEEEIRYLAFYDGLTGLANRMLFMDRIGMAIKDASRTKQRFALLFLDLDQFKRINDTMGHHIGDLLLKNVAETLKRCIRTSDSASRSPVDDPSSLVARLGGDEFTIMLSDIKSPGNAAIVARRLIKEMAEGYDFDGNEVSVTTSIGISVYPEDGADAETLLKHADSAMYHAKKSGRNNYQFYMESLNIETVERFSIERDLGKAIKNNEFILYYQPQINLHTRKIVGAEALIRWIHPHRGMIPPDRFIHIAEESGYIIDINKWVLNEACRQSNEWINNGLEAIRVAVNLSGYKIANQNILKSIESALNQSSFEAKNLELEITENILLKDTEDTLETLKEMKKFSLTLALDDFGTGYSSLSYLTSLPVDTIKIDKSFVMGSMLKNNNRVIIKAIVAMGHSLGKKIVAEGIETEEQYKLLKDYGCDEAQGFYFNPPVPADDFMKILERGYI